MNLFIFKGATGLAGPQGLHGLQGTIFLVTCGVSQTILIFCLSPSILGKGERGLPGLPGSQGPVGIRGMRGSHGEIGAPGRSGKDGGIGPQGPQVSNDCIQVQIDRMLEMNENHFILLIINCE